MTLTTIILATLPLIVGWCLDYFFGDPSWLPHPVVGFGKWISWGEKRWNNVTPVAEGTRNRAELENLRKERNLRFGAFFAVGSIFGTYAIARLVLLVLACVGPFAFCDFTGPFLPINYTAYLVVSSLLVFYCLAGHTLRKEVRMVFGAVDESLEKGRVQVGRIVGRDTKELDAQEIRTAALETLAENLSDGVVAPLFWYLLLGVPGMLAYKMVNTLDSMIGYQNERYKEFGCWAAKIDDVANFLPARLTAYLMYIVVWVFKKMKNPHFSFFDFKEAQAFLKKYSHQHASPNSGWPEAALAYILNCRFGGPHYYFGEYFYKPYIGNNARSLNTNDMKMSIAVSFGAELMMVVITLMLQIIPCLF